VPPNVVCLAVDGLQAGMLGCYGNAWVRTPQIDRLAAQGFVFDQAFVTDPMLDAVLNSLWRDKSASVPMTLITDDREVNDRASAEFENTLFVESSEPLLRAADSIEVTQCAQFVSAAVDWIAAAREPFCVWLYSRGFLGAWDAPRELREQFADEEDPTPPDFVDPPNRLLPANFDPDELLGITHAYAGQVSLFDTCLGVLVDAIEQSQFAANTLFVLVGIRGFPLGEHQRVGDCDRALFNELLHVPVIVRFPDGLGALSRTQAIATHADVATLIDEWLGVAPPRVMDLISGSTAAPWRDHLQMRSQKERAIRTAAWFLRSIDTRDTTRHELYVKPDDRWEVNDVADRCPEIVSQLMDHLDLPDEATIRLPEALTSTID
jgi:arylsulfatase A-like enzyme